jgi:hypothetical protein
MMRVTEKKIAIAAIKPLPRYTARTIALNDLAHIIAQRVIAVKALHAEKGEVAPGEELAHQFRVRCNNANLDGGPVTTAEMLLLASELVPWAMDRSLNPERIAA